MPVLPRIPKIPSKTSILTRWICINKLVFCFKGNLIQLNIYIFLKWKTACFCMILFVKISEKYSTFARNVIDMSKLKFDMEQ